MQRLGVVRLHDRLVGLARVVERALRLPRRRLLAEGADINAKFEPHGDSSFELAERSTSKGGQEVYQLLKVVYEKQLEKKRAELQKAQAAK